MGALSCRKIDTLRTLDPCMQPPVHQTESALFLILLQLIVMIGAARIFNTAVRALRQPGVIGEIVAGLVLGPSLFGYFFPVGSRALFGSSASLPITIISQIGLILLMFQIGSDFEFSHLSANRNRRGTIAIAIVSVCAPLVLGMTIGYFSAPRLAPATNAVNYSLFFGVGLAITAVPILGRILREYGLTRTQIGVVAISAAAANDVVGWILLAVVSAYAAARFSPANLAWQLGGLVLFGLVLWLVLRPLVARLMRTVPMHAEGLKPNLMATVVCLIFTLGMCTYKLGIFAIFGGFAAGLLFHRYENFVQAWRRQAGQFVMVFFLPVFFTFTGLRTNVLGLNAGADLLWLGVILGTAILAKVIPVYLVSRWVGFDARESTILGVLMNTRALMELIVLNIGFDLGFIPQKVFTMLVIMAVITTVMTGPLLKRLLPLAGYEIPVGVEA
jgi:Kef-type K+ transport system membrane component KefB